MEPCENTPDLFHGRTRAQTAALRPPPFRYTQTKVVRATVPPYYRPHADGTGDVLTIRRIEYTDNPLCQTVEPEDLGVILECWEILHNADPDYCEGVIFRRRDPETGRIFWSGYDGRWEQQEEMRSHVIWEVAVNGQRFGRSSTGWRKDRFPNPPEF